ncbi:hypothetical protein [Frankia gtarii]|uniref:hypothetical protein n=1 Tax=Frankia gtarii TaxID=2950102 RepID=UPI0021C0C6ED|nr:hypothetical protein [Frankia gtarii]
MTALSVLDQGPVTVARGPRAVLADAVDLARHVENLGIEVLRGDIVADGASAAATRLHAALHAAIQAAR